MIQDASTSSAPSAVADEPPAGLSSFLGREEELTELSRLLEGSGLITLTGAPGIGKSRLGLELARALAGDYPDGTRLVELASVGKGALVPQAVASALAVQEAPGESLTDTLVARLAKRRLLLVLDNCEHVLEACARLVDALLQRCPELSILATSREPLAVTGETVWAVPPLSVPAKSETMRPEVLEGYEAVDLFVERAAAVEPRFSLNAYVAPAVAEVCQGLDGIPLAIELAAARVETLTPAEIASRLDDRFGLLRQGRPTELARHETLEAALDWSHALLSASQRALLRRLSVFSGGFDREAAEAVSTGGEVEASAASEGLAQLVSKSLVVAGHRRFRLLETIRAYAGERLEESGEAPALREGHARFYLAFAEDAEPELTGPGQVRWFERLETERPNLRSALEWSLGHGRHEWALRLASALVLFWRVRCHFSEGRGLLEAAVSASNGSAPALRAKAVWGAGFLTLMTGDSEQAIPMLEDSLARFRELGDLQGQARALLALANAKQDSRDPSVLPLVEETAALAREVGDSWCLALALAVAGFEHVGQSEFSAARPILEESVRVAREARDKQSLRAGLLFLGQVALHQGDYRSAEDLLEEAMAIAEELGDDYSKGTTLQYLAGLALGRGEYGRARELLDGAISLLREARPADLMVSLTARAWVARVEGERALARGLLDEALSHAYASGDDPTPALLEVGELAAGQGEARTARRRFEEALDLSRSLKIEAHAAEALGGLGGLARAEGDPKRAALLYREALELHRQCGNTQGMTIALEALAGLSAENGQAEYAARLLGAVEALREANGYIRSPLRAAHFEADRARLRESLSTGQIEAAFRKGAALSLDQAVAEASRVPGLRGRRSGGWSQLTESEQQVASLASQGLTNRQIAETLFVSRGTVKDHLSQVFSKLGVAGRTDLAREVGRREQDLLRNEE